MLSLLFEQERAHINLHKANAICRIVADLDLKALQLDIIIVELHLEGKPVLLVEFTLPNRCEKFGLQVGRSVFQGYGLLFADKIV